ncbi:carbohydrate ABC transporter permease [Alkalicoccus daliensis]|uniref:Multiple sugar transport system permease protein n=1 Tax=Alkalicoccus daliensis TaxID=745820 RepID=A0A1H0F4B1_9BACI|nr:sugar ABC transporter permease [Alkalicoccus daliensis]SDN89403.1 multiple sugar transport system permease protein [Alkalicoccus daliensis]
MESVNETRPRKSKSWKEKLTPLLFIGPHLFFFLIFLAYPTIYGLVISFHNWNFFGDMSFAGLENYANILWVTDSLYFEYFWTAFRATFIFVILSVPPLIIIPLLIAVAINAKPPGQNFFRALFYAPSLLSVVTVVLIWIWLLDTNAGLVNYYIGTLGLDAIPWLTRTPWVWISLVLMTIWWTIGTNMILFLAGLGEISDQLYEAAKIDGANKIQQFFHVTLPGLKGPMAFVLVMTTLASFNVMAQPQLATGGGPGYETRVLILYIYEVGFTGGNPRAGLAAAMSVVLGMILLCISLVQFKLMSREK